MTRPDHPTGTDRIAEVALARGWNDEVVVVNVQGDEPRLPPQLIRTVAEQLAGYKRIRHVQIVDEIPRLPSGKALRRQLKDSFGVTDA